MCKDCGNNPCSCGGWHKGCTMSVLAKILVIVGGVNWGLVGLGALINGDDWNIVKMILGEMPKIEAIVYVVVGLAAVAMVFGCRCKKCMTACATCGVPEKAEEKMM